MSTIVVTLLPVGQGAMNLIEIYDGATLQHLTLIDCGVDRTRPAKYEFLPDYTRLSIDYVVEKMNERAGQVPGVYLDYVIFTHRDSDHWTLFDAILQKTFGPVSISNIANSVRSFHNIIDDTISEDFYGNWNRDFFSYTRAYSWDDNNLSVEYHRHIQHISEMTIMTEKLHFRNMEQDCTIIITMNYFSRLHECSVYAPADKPCRILARINEELSNEKQTYVEYYVTVRGKVTSKSKSLLCPYTEEPLALWQAWSLFITYLSEHELPDYQYLDLIAAVLGEWQSDGGFLHYTQQDIINILTKNETITSVIGEFLWGGNPDVDGKGIKRLRADSENLAQKGAREVYWTAVGNNQIQLLDNIYLDILARIPNYTFENIFIPDAASAFAKAILNNGTSLVTMLSVHRSAASDIERDLKFLFTGDATIHTFYIMYVSGSLEKAIGAVWTAPHHGSYTTIKGKNPKDGSDYFPYFLSYSKPNAMVIESGEGNKHGLPNISFYHWAKAQFEQSRVTCEPHYVYVNNNDGREADWIMVYTPYPIYSGVSAQENPIITYKIHRYTAATTATQYKHEEERIATDDPFRTPIRRRPGQPAPPPQALEDVELPPPPLKLFFRR